MYPTGIGPVQSIASGTSAAGAGASVDLGVPRSNHSLAILGSAGITAGAVKLEGSLDNKNWFQLVAPVTAVVSAVAAGSVADFPARYVRANISTAITGGTVGVLVASAGI